MTMVSRFVLAPTKEGVCLKGYCPSTYPPNRSSRRYGEGRPCISKNKMTFARPGKCTMSGKWELDGLFSLIYCYRPEAPKVRVSYARMLGNILTLGSRSWSFTTLHVLWDGIVCFVHRTSSPLPSHSSLHGSS
ncbi:hypothetical protein CNBC6950 [Cryptococcus deneoformans B-3501A]|uniref:hypothetical protein n=1 Tax=Cryptococcus deneoformans (strain B-3501A) TaxID=283643 RepID=UPI000042CB38|nr:hypothetical protein CNBC6950 [Cryptococcus neoformans var. neoformans B-3501A]EAL21659.1 hypothetical protein CNBC6950 [Cryptococcus neoformans var. neoformans B-3501A]